MSTRSMLLLRRSQPFPRRNVIQGWIGSSRSRCSSVRLRQVGFRSRRSPPPPLIRRVQSFSSLNKPSRSVATVIKEEDETDASIASSPTRFSTLQAYADLSKARLSALVVLTSGAGFVAGGGPISVDVLAACTIGTFFCSASASAFNQVLELDMDARMKRTRHRPLVTGDISKSQAVMAATVAGLTGTSVLAMGTDPVTTALGAGNIVLYAGLYTYLKPKSILNTWVGAVVGAIPPVMGWTAAGGSIMDIEALLLGGMLYLWQMPHFFALAYMHRVDYKRGGFCMVPCLEADGTKTASIIVRYAWYLSALPFVATATHVTSSMFCLEGMALNAYALHVAHRFQRDRANANARKIFLTSLWYLPCLLMLFLLHSHVWDKDEEKDDVIAKTISQYVHSIRDKGRSLCVHEAVVSDQGDEACPVTVASKTSREGVEAVKVTAETAVSTTLQETSTTDGTAAE